MRPELADRLQQARKPGPRNTPKAVSVYLNPEEYRELARAAQQYGTPISGLLRVAVHELLDQIRAGGAPGGGQIEKEG